MIVNQMDIHEKKKKTNLGLSHTIHKNQLQRNYNLNVKGKNNKTSLKKKKAEHCHEFVVIRDFFKKQHSKSKFNKGKG